MKKIIFLLPVLFLLLFATDLLAQQPVYRHKKKDTVRINPYLVDSVMQPIPMGRVLFHDNIDKEQLKADASHGITDKKVRIGDDSAANAILSKALFKDVDRLEIMVENFPANGKDAATDNQQKIKGLRALW